MRRQTMLVVVAGFAMAFVPRVANLSAQSSQQGGGRQQQTPMPNIPSQQQRGTLPSIDGSNDASRDDPTAAMREAQRSRSFATERQKKMIQDTDKLLALATELKQEMDKTNKNEMSMDVIRKAEEIERLAHDVKVRMKG